MAVKCRRYVIARGYIREGASLTRTLRSIVEGGGAILWKDEITRRVVFRMGPGSLLERGADFGDFVFEYNLVCGKPSTFNINKKKFNIINKNQWGVVAHGIAAGRYVLIELKNNKLYIKIGVGTAARSPPSILPPSTFILSLEDLADIEANLNKIISEIVGERACKPKEQAS